MIECYRETSFAPGEPGGHPTMTFGTIVQCLLGLVLLLLAAGGCSTTHLPDSTLPLAIYPGGEITLAEYRDWQLAKRKAGDPLREDLERLAVTNILASAAQEENLLSDPVTNFMVRRAEEAVLARALQEIQGESMSFTEDELRAAFEGRPENLFKPRKYRLHEIFLRSALDVSPETEAKYRRKAEALRIQLEEGADIAAMAREFSDSQTRFRGGYVGVVDPAKLAPSIAEAVVKLEEGELTPVLRTPDGFLILFCDFIVPERRNTFDENREKVRSILVRRETRRKWERLQQKLLEEAGPHYAFRALQDPETPEETIVLRHAGGELTYRQAATLLRSSARSGTNFSQWPESRLKAALDASIVQSMAARRARDLGLDQGPEIQARLRWRRKETLSMQELARMVSQRITAPSPEEIRKEIENNPLRYRLPAESLLSGIRLDGTAEDLRSRYEEATGLVEGIRAGELDFAKAAGRRSDHPSAAKDGDLGRHTQAQLASLGSSVAANVQEMELDEIRGPIQEKAALWILQLRDRSDPRPMDFAEARPLAEERLGNRHARALQLEIEAEILEGFRLMEQQTRPEGRVN
ncbi:MAG: peptidylprolyl isomerase [Thermoanaerobaculales bacterium]|nr:peptidylprolyl isomerase [Thermoanaerobaculales bacterium]